jgi:hypothetical protein
MNQVPYSGLIGPFEPHHELNWNGPVAFFLNFPIDRKKDLSVLMLDESWHPAR